MPGAEPFHGDHAFPGGTPFPGGSPFPGGMDPATGMPPGFMGQPGFPGGPMPGPGFGPGSPGWRRPGAYRTVSRPARLIARLIAVLVLLGFITVFLIARHIMSSQFSPSGTCVGGPAAGSTGQPLGNGNFRFNCQDGGSTVVHLSGTGN